MPVHSIATVQKINYSRVPQVLKRELRGQVCHASRRKPQDSAPMNTYARWMRWTEHHVAHLSFSTPRPGGPCAHAKRAKWGKSFSTEATLARAVFSVSRASVDDWCVFGLNERLASPRASHDLNAGGRALAVTVKKSFEKCGVSEAAR
jgi:hypothetical protein